MTRRPRRLVSGGQTGVDRAALDAALAAGLPHGGWVPAGRRAEDGPVPARYRGLRELASPDYAPRTEANVVDSDGTLILCDGAPTGGTALTARLARRHGRPLLVLDLSDLRDTEDAADQAAVLDAHRRAVRAWLDAHAVDVLNVAGPRASGAPDLPPRVRALLDGLLADG